MILEDKTRTLNNREWRKMAIFTFKYCPVTTAFVMFIHVALLLFGINLGYAESFCGISLLPIIVTYCLSKGLGFCKMHRAFIDYTFKIFLCIQWQLWIGFGGVLILYRWIMLLLGIGIFIYFIFNFKKFYNCTPLEIEKAPTLD